MRFEPKTEEQLNPIITPGVYMFEVLKAEDYIASTQREMIKLMLKIWLENGTTRVLTDYLSVDYKIKHFCDAAGLEAKYQSGEISAFDCENKSGYLKLTIKKDKTGQYPDQNAVADYVKKKDGEGLPVAASHPDDLDDDVPF